MEQADERPARWQLDFRALADGLPLMLGAARPDGCTDYTNREWHAFTGTPASGEPGHLPLGNGWPTFYHPDDLPGVRAAFEEGRRTCRTYDFRARLRRADGAWRWCVGRVTPHCDDHGRVRRWFWAIWDIDEQIRARDEAEQARAALQAERQRLSLVMEAAHIGFWDYDPQAGHASWSVEIYDLLGLPRGDGREPLDRFQGFIVEADRARALTVFEESIRTGCSFDAEFRIRRPDGTVRWLVGRGQALLDADGRMLRMMGVNFDVTAAREAQRNLEQANALKDEFLAMLGHELRNPIAPVSNAIQILRRAGDDPARRAAALDMMQRQMGHLTRLVDDLLEASRIRQGRITLRREPFPICDAIEAAVEAVRPQIEARRHALSLALPHTRPVVLADVTRIAQVVTNLLNNAAKYTPPGGRIDVTVLDHGDAVELRVQDNGTGIPAELLPRVFDLFTQAERTLERAEGGLGIGLALVKRLVEMHDGAVSAHSDGPGRGARFVVRLPVLAHQGETADSDVVVVPVPVPLPTEDVSTTIVAPARDMASAAAVRSLRVILVGAAPNWAESLAPLLRLDGHEATLAADEAELAGLALHAAPDAVLLRIGAPADFDRTRLDALRALPGLEQAAWLAVSGHGRADDRRQAVARGFADLLTLPVSYERAATALSALFPPPGPAS